jgi:serine/threonine protein kinase
MLAAMIKTDLRNRYALGQRLAVADYLVEFPQLRVEGDLVLSLIYEEYCLREEQGERLDSVEFCARYPSWHDSLASQLRYHRLLSQLAPPRPAAARFPLPGDRFGAFRIDSVLGLGGTARVYLARDEELGGRLVVLKISPNQGPEPSALGRLEHTYIMPALSVTRDESTGLRALCMPHRPGLPLDEVIRRVNPSGGPHSAKMLLGALCSSRTSPIGPGWDGFPGRGTYADAAAWVILGIALALDYVHSQGILHGDIKPANVLLALHHGPQLLDFGLARAPNSIEWAGITLHGGTLPYMSPEQLEAFLAPDLWKAVGPVADIYCLGLLLDELLSGRSPKLPDPRMPLPQAIRALIDEREASPPTSSFLERRVPRALGAIVARCLAFRPSDRYPDARSLIEDLQRYLNLRPSGRASSRSRGEHQAGRTRRPRPAAKFRGRMIR